MERIVLHRPGCPKLGNTMESQVDLPIEEMETLVLRVHGLLRKHQLPFYRVEPHNQNCPGRQFPWEDLEFKLFVLEH